MFCKHKDQKNLALEVTQEKVHDNKTIGKLVKHILDKTKNKIHSFIGDGAYDSNENFRFLKDYIIQPIIKLRRNSVVSSRNNEIINEEVIQQTRDFLKWKKKKNIGTGEW